MTFIKTNPIVCISAGCYNEQNINAEKNRRGIEDTAMTGKQKKYTAIKTKRLLLTRLDADETANLCANTSDANFRILCEDANRACEAEPLKTPWFALWRVELRPNNEPLGYLRFEGEPRDMTVTLKLDMLSLACSDEDAITAVHLLAEYAFGQDHLFWVRAAAESPRDEALLQADGYHRVSEEENPPVYEKEKPASTYMALFMCIGLSIGCSFGLTVFDNIGTGLCLGLALGVAIGASLDAADKKERQSRGTHKSDA